MQFDVVTHYNTHFKLDLGAQKNDLVEYLKGL
jgi:hypothetical protein